MAIRLHPKYGVNPSLGVCFWCGKENGNILLLGYNKNKEAPRRMVSDYEPCGECKAERAKGVVMIEVNEPPGFLGHPTPTGRWAVVSEQAIRENITPPSLAADILAKRQAHMDRQTFDSMFGALLAEQDSNKKD